MKVSAPPSQNAPPSGALCSALAFIQSKLQCSTIVGQRASSIGDVEEVGDAADLARQVAPSGRRNAAASRSADRGSSHQARCSPRTARTDGRRCSSQSWKYWRIDRIGRLDRRADPARRVVQRCVPELRWRWRGGCTCSRPRRGRRGRYRCIWPVGENTSASTGRWVLRKRRCVCASSAGSFTSLGGTRRSSQGDISATGTSSAPSKISWPTICCVQVVPDLA